MPLTRSLFTVCLVPTSKTVARDELHRLRYGQGLRGSEPPSSSSKTSQIKRSSIDVDDLLPSLSKCSRRKALMRVLRPVVCSQAPIVLSREPDRAERCRIGSQPVGHNPAWRKAVLLKQFHHEFLCGLGIASALDEEIQHLSLVVDRQSQYLPPRIEITISSEVPMIARSRSRTTDIRCDRRPELSGTTAGPSRRMRQYLARPAVPRHPERTL